VTPTCYALAAGLGTESDRGKNLAITAAGFTSAMVLGVPLGVYVARLLSWRGSFGFVALLAFVAAAALLRVGTPVATRANSPVSLRQQMRAVSRWQTPLVLAPFVLWSAASYGLYTYTPAILGQHLPAALIPVLLSIFGIGAVVGNVLAGFVADRVGVRGPTLSFLTVLILTLASVGIAGRTVLAAAIVLLVWAIAVSGLFTLQQQRVIASNPRHSGFMLALNNSALYLGASVGSALEGGVISTASLGAASPLSAAIAVVALLLLVALPQPETRDSGEAETRESRPAREG
jgi:predicted MFS family arabinose efflux permease